VGLRDGEWVGTGGVGVVAKAAALHETRDPAGDALDDAPHLAAFRRGWRPEAHVRLAIAFIDAVEHERVEVHARR